MDPLQKKIAYEVLLERARAELAANPNSSDTKTACIFVLWAASGYRLELDQVLSDIGIERSRLVEILAVGYKPKDRQMQVQHIRDMLDGFDAHSDLGSAA